MLAAGIVRRIVQAMNETARNFNVWSWFWTLLTVIFIVGVLAAIVIPNFIGSHTSKITGIINNLHQIDGAKNEWAIEHGFTNEEQILRLTNRLTKADLAPYLRIPTNRDGSFCSIMGEEYSVSPMNNSPEAKLVRSYYSYPKGSIIRLNRNSNRPPFELIFPDGTKVPWP